MKDLAPAFHSGLSPPTDLEKKQKLHHSIYAAGVVRLLHCIVDHGSFVITQVLHHASPRRRGEWKQYWRDRTPAKLLCLQDLA